MKIKIIETKKVELNKIELFGVIKYNKLIFVMNSSVCVEIYSKIFIILDICPCVADFRVLLGVEDREEKI